MGLVHTVWSRLWYELLRPVDGSPETLVTQYVVFISIGLTCQLGFRLVHRWVAEPVPSLFETHSYRTVAVSAVIVAPIAEELLFRALPLLAPASLQYSLLAGATGLWAVLHGRRGVVFAATGGLFFVKLWVYGYGLHAIALHAAHNLIAVSVLIGWHRLRHTPQDPPTPRIRA